MGSTKIPNRTFGVELEVAGISEEQAYLVLRLAGLNVEDPIDRDREDNTLWRFHEDGSIEDTQAGRDGRGFRTCEVVSPILTGLDGIRQVRKACDALTKAGAYVNTSCGLHIHVGAKDLTAKEVFTICKRYADHEEFIDSIMHSSRRAEKNEFCGSMKDTMSNLTGEGLRRNTERRIADYERALANTARDCQRYCGAQRPRNEAGVCPSCAPRQAEYTRELERLRQTNRGEFASIDALCQAAPERYRNVNLTAYQRHGTLEFRQHNGSIDGKKVCNWIRFVLNFVERSRALSGEKRAKVKDIKTKIQARKNVYLALKEAGEAGLSKEQILAASGGTWTMVRPNIHRLRQKFNLAIEEIGTGRARRWRIRLPVQGPNPIYRDLGPMMGLPRHIKSYFMDRAKIDTDDFKAWA